MANILGEKKLIQISKDFSEDDLLLFYLSLDTALACTQSSDKVKDKFPELFRILWNNKEPSFELIFKVQNLNTW